MMAKLINLIFNPFFFAGVFILIIIIITAQNLLLDPKTFEPGGLTYTHYNNYLIFKQSFFNLIENKDLYVLYPAKHWDFYKYSPTFSLFMAPLTLLPDTVGLFFWNLLNVFVLFLSLRYLPGQSDRTRLFMYSFLVLELTLAIQASQTNGLITGLIVFAFILFEKKQTVLATLLVVFSVFIKPFGLVALVFILFYPNKLKAVLYAIGWFLLLAILPLMVISFPQLIFLWKSWLILLLNDHSISYGFSVQGWLHSLFGLESKTVLMVTGIFLFCLPLVNYKYFNELRFKLFSLSSLLIWIVIFNHKAESPTFVIAVTGIAIWFASQKIKTENLVLVIIAFIFTVLSSTEFFPAVIRDNFVKPYVLKVVPCILIWLKITADLLFYRVGNSDVPGTISA